jgi:hypothetical protein
MCARTEPMKRPEPAIVRTRFPHDAHIVGNPERVTPSAGSGNERRLGSQLETRMGPPITRKPAILGMGNEPTDETAFSKGGSLTDMAEGTEERENDGTVRSPARS